MSTDMPIEANPEVRTTFERLRQAWLENRPVYEQRMDDMKRLREAFTMRLDEMAKAISADFGNRSQHETLLAEANIVFAEIDDALHHLKRWMKPKRRKAGWKMWPAKAEIRYVPLGVIGVIAPWNYPVNLALAPLVAAIAAGNHVFLKPSEHTPRTAATCRHADFPQPNYQHRYAHAPPMNITRPHYTNRIPHHIAIPTSQSVTVKREHIHTT